VDSKVMELTEYTDVVWPELSVVTTRIVDTTVEEATSGVVRVDLLVLLVGVGVGVVVSVVVDGAVVGDGEVVGVVVDASVVGDGVVFGVTEAAPETA